MVDVTGQAGQKPLTLAWWPDKGIQYRLKVVYHQTNSHGLTWSINTRTQATTKHEINLTTY